MSAHRKTIKTIGELKATARQLIGREAYDTAFDLLDDALLEKAELKPDLLAQQAKLNRTRRNKERGTLTPQDAEAAFTQVVYALDTLIAELKEKDLTPGILPISLVIEAEGEANTGTAKDNISALEKEGLEKEANLLQRKLNSLKEARITAYDATQKFALDEQIRAIEEQLQHIKQQLS